MTTDIKIEETIGKGLLVVVGTAIATPFAYLALLPFSIVNAWVLTILYGWFVLPIWPAVPNLGVAQMLGLNAFKSLLLYRPVKKDSETKLWSLGYLLNLCPGPLSLLFAYPIHWWLTH